MIADENLCINENDMSQQSDKKNNNKFMIEEQLNKIISQLNKQTVWSLFLQTKNKKYNHKDDGIGNKGDKQTVEK